MPALPRRLGAGSHLRQPRGGQDAGPWGRGGCGLQLRGPSQEICMWKCHPFVRLARK